MKRSVYVHHKVDKLVALFVLLVLFLAVSCPVLAQQPVRIIFLHHSCGHNLIEQGGVREGLTALGYEFYDHGYNDDGLRLADGSYTGTNFDVPGDNTDPDGFAEIFAQPLHDPPDNTFSHLMQYDVIAFKSCFPTSNVVDDYQLNEYKSHYLAIRDRVDQYPDKIFIAVTMPPELPNNADPEALARARAFTIWLQSDEYLAGHPNIFVFDFFDYLAGDDNFLRPEYRVDEYDAHPNERANRDVGPHFVAFIDQAIQSYDTDVPRPAPAAPTATAEPAAEPSPTPEQEPPPPPPDAPLPASGLIDDFEAAGDYWTSAETGSTIECAQDAGMAHGGTSSLRIDYAIAHGGWGDCGRDLDPHQDWSGGAGFSLWLRFEGEPEWLTLVVFSGAPDGPTPFEARLETALGSAGDWTQFAFPWADFVKAGWVGDEGLAEIDPTRITGYGFNFGTGEGTLWVDDVGLATGEEPLPVPVVIAEEPVEEPAEEPTQAPAEEPVEEPAEEPVEEPAEEESEGGICPGAAMALPLATAGVVLVSRWRR